MEYPDVFRLEDLTTEDLIDMLEESLEEYRDLMDNEPEPLKWDEHPAGWQRRRSWRMKVKRGRDLRREIRDILKEREVE